MDFDHEKQTGFALLGKHSIVDCQSCHFKLDFTEPDIIGAGCESCHVDVHQGAFSKTCTSCHNQERFTDVDGLFIHATTSFPLTGAHMQIECQSCHTNQQNGHFTSLDTECYDCHASDYDRAETLDHNENGFPFNCEQCHTTIAWQPAFFDHITESGGFALLGAHTMVDCASCHNIPSMEPKFAAANDQDCYACHSKEYQNEHGGSGFPTDCQACHSVNTWDDPNFNHAKASQGFELLGSHKKVDCQSCHTPDYGIVFNPPPLNQDDCYSCHVSDYEREHKGSTFPTTCIDCHNVKNWDDAEFEHSSVSNGFELLGSHEKLECQSCHTDDYGLVFSPPPLNQDDCYSCHVSDYQEEHKGSGFPTTCLDCHNINSWDDAEFDHVVASNGFELLGSHENLDCQSCHTADMGLVFNPPPLNQDDCYSCHVSDYQEEHKGSGFPTTCLDCHNINSWDDAEFDHVVASNGFELLGSHENLDCQSCHTADMGLVFNPPPVNQEDCYSCHVSDYEREHAGNGFATTCLDCHSVNTWDGADFTEHDNLFFPIYSGEHRGEWNSSCQTCHTTPDTFTQFSCFEGCHEHNKPEMDSEHRGVNGYMYVSTACYSCHPNGDEGDDDD